MKDEFKIEIVPNKSMTYMLPLLTERFNFDLENGLANSYLSFNDDDDEFCILYKWSSNPKFLKFEGKLMAHGLFVKHEDYNNYTIYRFKLTEEMSKGKKKFVKGLYKEFSDEHKNAIIENLTKKKAKNISRIKEILDPDGHLSSTSPDMIKETFSNNIRKLKVVSDDFS
jgi:hypothetical protein